MLDAKKILSEQFNGLTETLQKVITFKTEKGVPAPGAPFGTEVKKDVYKRQISDHLLTGEALSSEERQNSFHEMMELALEIA